MWNLHWYGIHRAGKTLRSEGFSTAGEYAVVLGRLAQRTFFAITSFILSWPNDTPGVGSEPR